VEFVLVILAALSLAACDKSRGGSPVDAYLSFSRAVQRGDAKAAYPLLSSRTQQKLAARAKEISAASGGAIKDDPAALAFSSAPRPDPLNEVKLLSQAGDRATLEVQAGGRTERLTMLKEKSGWKVDLGD
jgi:hypothetical protein